MLTPSTTALPADGTIRRTLPRVPRFLPAITSTWSPFLIFSFIDAPRSQYFRRERHDLHEPALPQLSGHRSEHPGAHRLARLVDQHRRVALEPDVTAVLAAVLLDRAHHHRLHDLPLLDRAVGR